jgi:hypothetical protein
VRRKEADERSEGGEGGHAQPTEGSLTAPLTQVLGFLSPMKQHGRPMPQRCPSLPTME